MDTSFYQPILAYLRHLTSFYPGPFGLFFQKLLAVVFGLCLLSAIAAEIWVLVSKRKKDFISVKLGKKIFNFGLTFGLTGFLFLFFAREQVYFFGARFWFLLWLVPAVIWSIFIIRYALIEMPKEKLKRAEQARISQYLPHKR